MRKHCPKIPCILIANKIDGKLPIPSPPDLSVKKDVTKQKFGFAEKNGMPLFFTSAADGTNVVKVSQPSKTHPSRYSKRF